MEKEAVSLSLSNDTALLLLVERLFPSSPPLLGLNVSFLSDGDEALSFLLMEYRFTGNMGRSGS